MSIVQAAKSGLNGIKNGRAYVDNLANKAIVKPANAEGIGGFVFDYEGESSISLASEITDHYIEDNTAIQDHIALKPIRLTLRGFVSELVYIKPAGILGLLGATQSGLTQLTAYLGDNTPQMTQQLLAAATAAKSAINAFDQAVSRVENIVNLFSNSGAAQTKQQKAYEQLASLWFSKCIMTVNTPFKFYDSMAIDLVTLVQDQETKTIADISVTLKEIRQASIEESTYSFGMYMGRGDQQRQPAKDLGKTPGTTKAPSILKQVFNKVTG